MIFYVLVRLCERDSFIETDSNIKNHTNHKESPAARDKLCQKLIILSQLRFEEKTSKFLIQNSKLLYENQTI